MNTVIDLELAPSPDPAPARLNRQRPAAKPIVFLFPGLRGAAEELASLQAGCAPSIQCVSLSYPDWTDIHNRAVGLAELVEQCVAQIVRQAPSGPVLLAGYSFGGHIAFAVAAALTARRRDVALLGLLDTHANPPLWAERLTMVQHLRRLAKATRDGEIIARIAHLVARALMRSRAPMPLRLFAAVRRSRLPVPLRRHVDESLQMQFRLIVLRQLLDTMAAPVPLDCPSVLFRCTDQPPCVSHDLGWSRHLTDLRIVPVPGDHVSLMAPPGITPLCDALIAAAIATP